MNEYLKTLSNNGKQLKKERSRRTIAASFNYSANIDKQYAIKYSRKQEERAFIDNFEELNISKLERDDLVPSFITPLQVVDIEVTHIDDPSCFYIQKLLDFEKLEIIFNEVNNTAECSEKVSISDVKTGQLYLGRFTNDNNYYRAKVMCVDEGGVNVKYVDYGNSELINPSRLRVCPRELSLEAIPPFEIPCALWGITSNDWSDEAINLFSELVMHRKLSVCIVEEIVFNGFKKYLVNLQMPSVVEKYNPVSIVEVLIFFKFATASEEFSESKGQSMTYTRTYGLQHIKMNADPVSVKSGVIYSPHLFYLQLSSAIKEFTSLTQQMQYHFGEVQNSCNWKIYIPKPGLLCAVKSERDDQWYRGVILEASSPSEITVQLVDTGGTIICSLKDVRKIPEKFVNIPIQAIKCQLKDLVSTSNDGVWPKEAIESMSSFVKNKKLRAMFHHRENDLYNITLLNQTEDDIGQLLIDNNHAIRKRPKVNSYLMRKTLDNLSINTLADTTFASSRTVKRYHGRKKQDMLDDFFAEKEQLGIENIEDEKTNKHFVHFLDIISPGTIFVRIKSVDEKFIWIQQELQASSPSKKLYTLEKGEVCGVYIPKEGYFRIKVLDIKSDSIQVFLMDRGGIRWLPIKSTFQISERLKKKEPPLSLVVSLAHVQPTCGLTTWSMTATDFVRDILTRVNELYIIKKGSFYRNTNHNLKVLPVELGWIHQMHEDLFEEKKQVHSSVNTYLLEMGLGLPCRTSSNKLSIELSKGSLTSKKESGKENGQLLECFGESGRKGMEVPESSTKKTENPFPENPFKMNIPEPFSNPPQKENVIPRFQLPHHETEFSKPSEQKVKQIIMNERAKFSGVVSVKRRWKPPLLINKKNFLARVTNVDLQGNVSLYLIRDAEAKLLEMEAVHDYEFRKTQSGNEDLLWEEGDPVVARFASDRKWYRATIIKLLDSNKVQIEFLDYGNRDTVPVRDIRTKVTFIHVPTLSYKCVIGGITPIHPKGWQVEDLDFFHSICVDKVCNVELLEPHTVGKKLKIRLTIQETETEVASILVKTNICRYTSHYVNADKNASLKLVDNEDEECEIEDTDDESVPSLENSSDEEVIVEEVNQDEEENQDEEITKDNNRDIQESTSHLNNSKWKQLEHFPLPQTHDRIPVNITGIIDPVHIFVSLKENYDLVSAIHVSFLELKELMKKKVDSYDILENPEPGIICLAYSEATKQWHRASIISLQSFKATVFFVDYGFQDEIPVNSLRVPPPECFSTPAMCIRVKLIGINPVEGLEWGEAAMEKMVKCLFHSNWNFKIEIVKHDSSPIEVKIYVQETDEPAVPLTDYLDQKLFSFDWNYH